MIRCLGIIMMLLAASVAVAQQPAAPATQPREGIVVREWLILVSDPYQPAANAAVLFNDTLPEFVETRRPRMPAAERVNRPMPIGVIRLSAPNGTKLSVQLNAGQGAFLSYWPASRLVGNVLRWQDVTIPGTGRAPAAMDERHWLIDLRQPGMPLLAAADQVEGFLLYDVGLTFPTQLSVARGTSTESLKLAHAGYTPLRDLVLYRPDGGDKWSTAALPAVAPPAGATPPRIVASPAPARGGAQNPELQLREQQAQLVRQRLLQMQAQQQALLQQQAGLQAAEVQALIQALEQQQRQLEGQLLQQPAPVPTIDPYAAAQRPGALDVSFAPSAAASLPNLLAEWKERLASYELPATDIDVILRILQAQIEDSGRLTAVYRMEDAELNRLLPLAVVPAPANVKRVALVVVKNIDPAIPGEIDGLIAKLGDNDWKTREAAMRDLAGMGPAARMKLQAALTSRDAEISLRAERLLSRFPGSTPTARPAGGYDLIGPGILIAQ